MKNKYIISIDLGGTNLRIALVDKDLQIKDRFVLCTPVFTTKQSLISAVVSSINKIISTNHLTKSDVLGIGLGLPGPIDYKNGIVHFFPNIPGWKNVLLKDNLETKLGIKVFVDNDAKVMTLAESRIGAARGAKHVVCVTLGTGVGGGLILDGKLFRASTNATGELGHIPINETGPKCNCGGIACLEAYIGNKRILQQAEKIFKKKITLEQLSALARKGNLNAIKIWKDVGRILGVALSGVVNLLSPDCIVIGGGVANAGKVLFDQVRETILERAMSVQAKHVKIYKAALGKDAGLIGAAILVREGV
ncbi:MAG: ROK family protein [Candidatus Omnitrophica bacterium]|nr:ROK family protein [Candidatus Omnitrophota bacterium]